MADAPSCCPAGAICAKCCKHFFECLQYINNDEIKDAIPPIGLRVLFRVDGVEGGLNRIFLCYLK